MNWKFLLAASRVVVGCVFIIASFYKILYPADFALAVYRYQLLPDSWINITALIFPWLELVCGVLIIASRKLDEAAAVWIIVMLVVFIGAMGINIYRGVDISCGCFTSGEGSHSVGMQNILRNMGLIVLSVVVLLRRRDY